MCEFVRLWVGGCKYRIRGKYGGSYGVGELDSGQVSCFVIGVGEGSFVRMLVRILGMEGGRGGNWRSEGGYLTRGKRENEVEEWRED